MDETFFNRVPQTNRTPNEVQRTINFNGEMLTRIKNLHKNVYLVKDVKNNQYAMKILGLSGDQRKNLAAYNEIDLIKKAKHENILKYFGQYNEHNTLYLITEYCEDGDLSQVIEHYKKNKIFFPEEKIFQIFLQFMNGLSYIHNQLNVIHKDLKPGNLFMKNDTVKIGDFGISRTLGGNTKTIFGEGTFFYMSPEIIQAKSNEDYDCKTDIWSAACIMYEVITLKRAFSAINVYDVSHLITHGKEPEVENNFLLGPILNRMFQKDKNLRISSKELSEKLKLIYDEKQKRDRKLTKIYLDNLVKRERGYFYKERFLFVNQLGAKSFGKVYLVDEVELKERRILKAVKNNIPETDKSLFLADLNKIKKLNSPYIVKFYEHFDEMGLLFTISEYCLNGDLKEYINECIEDRRCIPLGEVIRMSKQMLRGLHDLHSINVLHRNLKPSNVFMDLDRVKIGDILPNISLIDSTFSGNGMGGAPYYKSPESIKGEKFTVQSDIWSIGCIMFECLKLQKAFYENNPFQTFTKIIEFDPIQGAGLDERIKPIVEKMLKKKPNERYNSALEVINDLEKILLPEEEIQENEIRLEEIQDTNMDTS